MGDPSQAPPSYVCVCTHQSIMAPRYRARDVTKNIFSPLVILIVLAPWCPPLPTGITGGIFVYSSHNPYIICLDLPTPAHVLSEHKRQIQTSFHTYIIRTAWCPPLRMWSHRRRIQTSPHPLYDLPPVAYLPFTLLLVSKGRQFDPIGFLIVAQ
jgi:hypothetical protein